MADKFIISSSPHIHSRESASRAIWQVFWALIPSGAAALFIFGWPALKVMLLSMASCLATAALLQKARQKKVTLSDGSAALTGLLLAYNLPASVPFWIPLAGGFFAIAIAKEAFGGLGNNIFNPALAARAFLMASWPREMTTFFAVRGRDTVASATPLAMLKETKAASLSQMGLSYGDLFLGLRPGCLGEVCILVLLLGAAYLLWKGYIWPQAPLAFIFTTAALSWIFSAQGYFKGDALFSVLSGGLILGSFFMATDYVTTPLTKKGQLVFGLGCGVITFLIRRFGGYPEGVSYAILMMNAFTALIDRHIRPRRYGA